jgi:peptide deformylase
MKEIRQAEWYDAGAPPVVKASPHSVGSPFGPGR